jgi:Na+/melibiose symporter-like transporter
MAQLFRNKAFRAYFPALALSMFGDSALLITLGVWVQSLTGSSAGAGATYLCLALPSLVAPAAGVLIDRMSRRALLIAANLGSAAMVLALLSVHDASQVWIIYLVSIGYGVSFVLIGGAQGGLYKAMLPEEILVDATGTVQTVREGLRLVGPLLGAALFAIAGPQLVVLLDAASFLIAAATLSLLRVSEQVITPVRQRILAETTAGIRHIWRVRPLRDMALLTSAAYLVVGFIETAGFALNTQGLHRPPSFIGVLLTVQGVGAIIGGVVAARMVKRLGERTAVGLGHLCFAVGAGLLATASLPTVLVGMALVGLAQPWLVVGLSTLFLRLTPSDVIGRVSTASSMLIGLPQVTSIGLGAVAASLLDYRLLLLAMLVALAATGLSLCLAGRGPRSTDTVPRQEISVSVSKKTALHKEEA